MIQNKIALFIKNDFVAVLSIAADEEGGVIIRKDPRDTIPQMAVFDSKEGAFDAFNLSVNSSKENGWRLFYLGAPNYG